MRYISRLNNLVSLSIPSSHVMLKHTFNSFYLANRLNSMLNIVSEKSKHQANDIETNNNKPLVYINKVRRAKHYPPANKE